MASSSSPDKDETYNLTSIFKENLFIGPAKQKFVSLEEQGQKSLDNFCQYWRNYEQPESYMIPPIFKFKNPDMSDDVIQKIKEEQGTNGKGINPEVKWRLCEEAERIIYDAIYKLIQENFQAPFIAVHNFDLKLDYLPKKDKLTGTLIDIYPYSKVDWRKFQNMVRVAFSDQKRSGNCEFDFLLIGPRIGIVVIEVKSSSFEQDEQFDFDYMKGVAQLDCADALIYLLQMITNVKTTIETPIKKILFTPNLEKQRFENWKKSLQHNSDFSRIQKCEQIVKWFKEDVGELLNKNNQSVCLLQNLFESTHNKIQKTFFQKDVIEIYENYGRIIATISSIIILKSNDHAHFSAAKAMQAEHVRISTQNPFEKQNEPKRTEAEKLVSSLLLTKTSNLNNKHKTPVFEQMKIIFLSPNQMKAVNGDNRQFLIGAAGTGKTIVLQAKALELLQKGEMVCIYATINTYSHWKALLKDFPSNLYKMSNWYNLTFPWLTTKWIQNTYSEIMDGNGNPNQLLKYVINDIAKLQKGELIDISSRKDQLSDPNTSKIFKEVEHLTTLCKKLGLTGKHPEHIFFDDALCHGFYENEDVCIQLFFIIMIIAKWTCPNTCIWLVIDPNQFERESLQDEDIKKQWAISKPTFVSSGDNYTITILNQVMRCSDNVFRTAYDIDNWPRSLIFGLSLNEFKPILGHKISGITTRFIRKTCQQKEDILKLLPEIIETLKLTDFYEINDIAIILSADSVEDICDVSASSIITTLQTLLPAYTIVDGKTIPEPGERTIVVLDHMQSIYSLEWPMVIHVWCSTENDPKYKQNISKYISDKYVAQSRATVALVCVELEIVLSEDKSDN